MVRKKIFREMNSLGITGSSMAAGQRVSIELSAVFKRGATRQLTCASPIICARRSLAASSRFGEPDAAIAPGFAIRCCTSTAPANPGLGRLTDGDITADAKAKLAELLRWRLKRLHIQLHWNPDRRSMTCSMWSRTSTRIIRSASCAGGAASLQRSEDNLKRIESAGPVGACRTGPIRRPSGCRREVARDQAKLMPRIASAMARLTVAAGTDAHRVSSYQSVVSLQWYLDGNDHRRVQTVARRRPRAAARRSKCTPAIRLHANDDDKRGTLETGNSPTLRCVRGLSDGAGERDRKDPVGADDGGRRSGVCGGAVCEFSPRRQPLDYSVICDPFARMTARAPEPQ